MNSYYVWDREADAVAPVDAMEWALSFEGSSRRVAHDTINGYDMSTVFLGMSHGGPPSAPSIFETMVFVHDTTDKHYCERYSTPAQARSGHARICKAVREGTLPGGN